ncbi:MAG: FAD-dependent oxidoreductase [Candidatus Syntropharchaeia archaeon]
MIDAVAVIGGGIAGIEASLRLSEQGFRVYLIERERSLGGKVMRIGECITGITPEIIEVENDPNIEVLTSSEVKVLSGSEGNFELTVVRENEEIKINVGSILLAPGYDGFDPGIWKRYKLKNPNIYTSLEFERYISTSGPVKGKLPENVKKIAFIQCIGSRDESVNPICSTVCCMYTAREIKLLKERNPDKEICVFYMDLRVFGKDEDLVERLEKEGVRYIRSRVSEILERGEKLLIRFEDREGVKEEEFDLIVLAIGLLPSKSIEKLSEITGAEVNEYGYFKTDVKNPYQTTVPGIYVCGTATGPKSISDSIVQAFGAISRISRKLPERIVKEAPEIEIGREKRIGVFICGCKGEIRESIDIGRLSEYSRSLEDVIYVKDDIDTCSQARDAIKEGIKKEKLNRIVFAGCSPQKYEKFFRNACRDAGLNPYLLEMVNIREGCALVHDGEGATEKACDLIRMAVSKARNLVPIPIQRFPITKRALVIGGGISGMTAALEIADHGFEVYLVEKEELGGLLKGIRFLQDGTKASELLEDLVERVNGNPLIKVFTNAEIRSVQGSVGDFIVKIVSGESMEETSFGAVVIAVGAEEFDPEGYYEYRKNEKVITQREFENVIDTAENVKTVVMIQCVASRNEKRGCSRICCIEAIKNAIRMKEKNRYTEIYILHRDIRTYGIWESLYRKARKLGVIFIRYEEEPQFENGIISVEDSISSYNIQIKPDYVVLSTPLVPRKENEEISKKFKLRLNKYGFFAEMQEKPEIGLRPLHSTVDGIFICGSARYPPKTADECIAEGIGVAERVCSLLSKGFIESEGVFARIEENSCIACETCVQLCPYGAVEMVFDRARIISPFLCRGCGICAAECPARAISVGCYEDIQVFAQIEEALR